MALPDIRPERFKHLLLAGARLFDPRSKLDTTADLLIDAGRIQKIGKVEGFDGLRIDGTGLTAVPGFVDMHVHLREPGREDEETIRTGAMAAAAGGFTEVACMPNTEPPIDDRSRVEFVNERAAGLVAAVHPVAAVTRGQAGEELVEMGDCAEAGAVAFSDDGKPVEKASVMRKALEYAGMFDKPILSHCEDRSLSECGAMHEGFVSTLLGFKGIPSISEEIAVARDIRIAEYVRGRLHVQHVSTAGSVRLIREAKARGVRVTAETCPHYLVLTDEAVRTFDANAKMNPPLRTQADQDALWEGLKDGTLDAVCTDHAPHSPEEKDAEYDSAPFGIVGLETAVGILLTHGVQAGRLTLKDLVRMFSFAPRTILGLSEARIAEGAEANLTLLRPAAEWTVDRDRFYSKSRNTPFHEWKLKGAGAGIIRNAQALFFGSQSQTKDP
jgi:dihydroorotase